MADLVTLDDAKDHLKIFDTAHDGEVAARIADASVHVLEYLNLAEDPAWDPDTVPPDVRAAVLVHLTLLWVHRDDWSKDTIEAGTADGFANLLRQRRRPAIG